MRSFKDQLEIDKKAVFLNTLEFAEPHEIGGVMINCVIDAETFKINQKYGETFEIEGTYTDGFTVFADGKDFHGVLPGAETSLEIDGEYYRVLNARRDGGIFEIDVYRHAEGDY